MDYQLLAKSAPQKNGATQEWVFQILRNSIINGDLPSGTQLKQDEISTALCVSHIPVREALRQLEAQGLVRIHPNRGATVTQLSRDSLEDMMEIRASISYCLLRRAVPLMTRDDFAQLQEIIEEEKHVAGLMETEALNYRFHELLTKKAGHSTADLIIEILHANMDRYLRSGFYTGEDARENSIHEHQAILDACREGDAEKAASLLQDHILDARNRIPSNL